MDREELISLIEENSLDELISWFGSENAMFNFINKHKLWEHVDYLDSDIQNKFLIWAYQNDINTFRKWVSSYLDDVEFDKSGNAYLVRKKRSDLADLFCKSDRNGLDRDSIEKILDEDGDIFEPFWDTTDNVYRDVIEELNEENLQKLKTIMVKQLKGDQLSPETEEMELIASEQGHNDYWELNTENVTRIIDDEESMNSLLDDELSDLKSELYSVHNNAYNSAYESDVWDSIWKELQDYFDGTGEFINRPHPFKENTTVQLFKIPIKNVNDILIGYLSDNKDGGSYSNLEYWGSILSIINEQNNCLSVRYSDYPDYHKVDKNINEYFSDFL